jgi:hypothetical protein
VAHAHSRPNRVLAVNILHADNLSIPPDPPVAQPVAIAGGENPPEQRPPVLEADEAQDRRPQKGLAGWTEAWLKEGYSLSWLFSALIHTSIVVLLSLLMLDDMGDGPVLWLEGSVAADVAETIDLEESSLSAEGGDFSLPRETALVLPTLGSSPSVSLADPTLAQTLITLKTETGSLQAAPAIGNLMASLGGGLDGRSLANRRRLALGGGGSEASESAVELGLAWLAAHQSPDGGWRFNLEDLPACGGACRDSGFVESSTGSTGLALLCFLGAGYTQHEGPHQEVVSSGIYHLVDQMIITSEGGDLRGQTILDQLGEGSPRIRQSGDMYSHGIATLALCEAYALSRDKNLAQPSQLAVDFIVNAQHEQGGWRYHPRDPGDTTVSGWQVTALKSGLLADLHVPRDVWYRATEYFDSVQDSRGATYGYQTPSTKRRSTSVVGLFCRMLLGWPKDHTPLRRGMAQIAAESPLESNMYFNYYATQALYHLGGKGWKKWNPRMRDHLVGTQAQQGHEQGSWFFKEAWSDRGGRLYTTTLSILTLEVYYRYLPMYDDAFVDLAP